MDSIKLLEKMSQFVSDTDDDKLSVMVARVSSRLMNPEMLVQYPLTEAEKKIIRHFE